MRHHQFVSRFSTGCSSRHFINQGNTLETAHNSTDRSTHCKTCRVKNKSDKRMRERGRDWRCRQCRDIHPVNINTNYHIKPFCTYHKSLSPFLSNCQNSAYNQNKMVQGTAYCQTLC